MGLILRDRLGPDWKIQVHKLRHVLSETEWKEGRRPLARDECEDQAAA
jgi:hypothetical protein